MDPLPPTDRLLRHPALNGAAALFRAGVAHVYFRQLAERAARLLDENRRVREIAADLLDARLVPDPAAN